MSISSSVIVAHSSVGTTLQGYMRDSPQSVSMALMYFVSHRGCADKVDYFFSTGNFVIGISVLKVILVPNLFCLCEQYDPVFKLIKIVITLVIVIRYLNASSTNLLIEAFRVVIHNMSCPF